MVPELQPAHDQLPPAHCSETTCTVGGLAETTEQTPYKVNSRCANSKAWCHASKNLHACEIGCAKFSYVVLREEGTTRDYREHMCPSPQGAMTLVSENILVRDNSDEARQRRNSLCNEVIRHGRRVLPHRSTPTLLKLRNRHHVTPVTAPHLQASAPISIAPSSLTPRHYY